MQEPRGPHGDRLWNDLTDEEKDEQYEWAIRNMRFLRGDLSVYKRELDEYKRGKKRTGWLINLWRSLWWGKQKAV